MTNRILAASLLVALTTLPAFAASTMPSTGPAPTGDPVVNTGGEIDSPGEPFRPWSNDNNRRPSRGGGGSDGGDVPPNQPQATTGDLICRVRMADDGLAHNYLVNDTGATIPAGSKVTIHIQPGDVVRYFVLVDDWPAGKMKDVLAGWSLPDGAECSASFGPHNPPAEQPAGDPPEVMGFVTGDTGHLGKPGEMLSSGACVVDRASGVTFINSGYATWPAGTHVTVTLPNGQVFEMTFGQPFQKLNGVTIPPELVYYPEVGPVPGELLPLDWTCQIEVEFPPAGN